MCIRDSPGTFVLGHESGHGVAFLKKVGRLYTTPQGGRCYKITDVYKRQPCPCAASAAYFSYSAARRDTVSASEA